ncbi:hypothetical protein [Nocardia sp. NPDC127526]|uniref:hypothetical protein n=1 Tax=Nocardia sp. NPDC127526 TaxID=3345393 RepID=UPI0036375046
MQDSPLLIVPPARMPCRYFLLRHRLARLLRALGVDSTDSIETLAAAVAQRLGVSIDLAEYPFRVPGFFAATIRTDDGYHVLVQSETSREHQAHITGHELAHILCGTTESAAQAIVNGTHRTGDYSNPEERDAEFVARTLTTWIRADLDARLPTQADAHAARLMRSLEDRIAWA